MATETLTLTRTRYKGTSVDTQVANNYVGNVYASGSAEYYRIKLSFTPTKTLSSVTFTLQYSGNNKVTAITYRSGYTTGSTVIGKTSTSGSSFTWNTSTRSATRTISGTFNAGTEYHFWVWSPDKALGYVVISSYSATGTVKEYTVSYNANGGTGAPSAQTKSYGTTLTLSSTKPTKSNTTATGYTITFNGNGGTPSKTSAAATDTTSYTFSKWNTEADGSGTSYNAGGSYTANAAATLYAQYTSSTIKGSITTATASRANGSTSCTVTINANGGSSSITSQTSTATITYTCSGWYTATSGGTKRASAGASYTPTATETVYAQWTSTTGTYSAVTLPTTAQCTRTGYILLGFATSNTATTATYAPGASYTPSKDITLYAVWKADVSPVYIKDSSGNFNAYYAYIANSNGEFELYSAYIYTNNEWKECIM